MNFWLHRAYGPYFKRNIQTAGEEYYIKAMFGSGSMFFDCPLAPSEEQLPAAKRRKTEQDAMLDLVTKEEAKLTQWQKDQQPWKLSEDEKKGMKLCGEEKLDFLSLLNKNKGDEEKTSVEWKNATPIDLRFQIGDRVFCNLGAPLYFRPGTVQERWVQQQGDWCPYLVVVDGKSRGDMIAVPDDDDSVCMRETCFPANEFGNSLITHVSKYQKDKRYRKLRFPVGEKVAFRVMDDDDEMDCWIEGTVLKHWVELPGFKYVKEENVLQPWTQRKMVAPYLFSADFEEAEKCLFYGHEDDHTLVRLPQNKPRKRVRGIVERFETRSVHNSSGEPNDSHLETIDHVTGIARPVKGSQGAG